MRIASAVVVAAMALAATVALQHLPQATSLPAHWDLSGQPNRIDVASHALLMPVVAAAGVSLLMAVLPAIEPMQRGLTQSAPLYRTAWVAALVLSAMVEGIVAARAFHISLPPSFTMVPPGLALIALGNVLPKSRPGFFVGIRTPWTLIDPENWIATHRLGSRTFMAAGALIVLGAFMTPAFRQAFLIGAISLSLVPVPYSWWRWHQAARD